MLETPGTTKDGDPGRTGQGGSHGLGRQATDRVAGRGSWKWTKQTSIQRRIWKREGEGIEAYCAIPQAERDRVERGEGDQEGKMNCGGQEK